MTYSKCEHHTLPKTLRVTTGNRKEPNGQRKPVLTGGKRDQNRQGYCQKKEKIDGFKRSDMIWKMSNIEVRLVVNGQSMEVQFETKLSYEVKILQVQTEYTTETKWTTLFGIKTLEYLEKT